MKSAELQTLVKHEVIGSKIEVLRCTQPSHVGLKGLVVDETLHTILIKKKDKEVRIQKKTILAKLTFTDKQTVEIDGNKLINRPEERLKKHWRKIRHGKRKM